MPVDILSDPAMMQAYMETFFPYATRKMAQMKEKGTRFAHYTSAENALRIISGNCVWLRNTNVMNDFSEVQHGHACILAAWEDDSVGGRLRRALDTVETGLADSIMQRFRDTERLRALDSYMVAISEHGNADSREDLYGRLSMWRAYGGNTNVAFVFNSAPFFNESDALTAYTSPVLYADAEMFKPHFLEVVQGAERHLAILKALGRDVISHALISALHFGALSTKHPGFWEEREWRVIFSPSFSITGRISDKLKSSIESVGGVPQRIYKLMLENYPDEGHTGATIPELLEEVIIGPTQYPWPIYDALVEKLSAVGVADAGKKVRVSQIPLRR
jgi:hypothetical protein